MLECNMTANIAQTFSDAKLCIDAPTMTSEVFKQTQQTLENLFNLYALHD